jgi:enoyl-CoA hydratase
MTEQPVRVERSGAVTTVYLHRPARRNAVDGPAAAALAAAFRAFDADQDAAVAVLHGEGGVFCSGADLTALGTERGNRVAPDGDAPMGVSRLRLSKPVIAAVSGYAVAGGLELALWCDLRVADETAVFGVFCRRWGVPLVDGGTVRLPRLIGTSRAMDMILTGRAVGAREALAFGLANRVVPAGQALAAARELAAGLAAFPQVCLRSDRASVLDQQGLDEAAALASEFTHGRQALNSEAIPGAARFAAGAGRHGSFGPLPGRVSQNRGWPRLPCMSSSLAYTRSGSGAPLVLLHGIGLNRRSWNPVVPALARQFDVIAVDLPGFGDSALASPAQAGPRALAEAVAGLLTELGVTTPHLAGNSLGGWVALELAAIRPVASVTLVDPAGLWRGDAPLYCRISLRTSRWLARHATRLLCRLVNYRAGRALVLGQTHGHPTRLTPAYAREAVTSMGTCPGFEATLAATARCRYLATAPITAPLTLAFGSRDVLLLPRQSRHVDQLPPGTQAETLPGGGHVPMPDAPGAVAELITRTAARAGQAPAVR